MRLLTFLLFFVLPLGAIAAEARVSWTPNAPEENVIGYKVYYDTDGHDDDYEGTDADQGPSPIDVPLEFLDDPENPRFAVTGLTSCRTYYFALTAYNEDGESTYSNLAETTVIHRAANLRAEALDSRQVRLTWDAQDLNDLGRVTQYLIHWSQQEGGPYDEIDSPMPTPTNNGVVNLLEPGTTYYFTVESRCENGDGKFSDEEISVTTLEVDDSVPVQPGDPMDPMEPSEDDANHTTHSDDSCASVGGVPSAFLFWIALVFCNRKRHLS